MKSVNKDGRSSIFLLAKKGKKQFKKSIQIKVKPSDWLPRNSQVKGTSLNSIIINRRLTEITNNMNLAWSSFENGSYSWDELCIKLGGGNASTSQSLDGFLETVLKAKYDNENSYNTYVGVVKAVYKEAEIDKILLPDLTNEFIGKCVQGWKKRLSPISVRTYLTHLGKIKNLAYQKGLISEPFIRRDEWNVKKGSSIKIVETVKTEDFLEAIPRAKDIYDIQSLFFYLLMFCLRGLYQADIVTMHKYANNLDINDSEAGWDKRRFIKHERSKSGELMEIKINIYPTHNLIAVLALLVERTHKQKINKRTGKPFGKGNYDVIPEKMSDGWIFAYDINNATVHKNVWDVYQKRIKKLLGKPFKTARKTFESYALKLAISQDIRYKLLGHANPTIKAHYQDWEWDELKIQVDDAHELVLKEYRAEDIYKAIHKRGRELGL